MLIHVHVGNLLTAVLIVHHNLHLVNVAFEPSKECHHTIITSHVITHMGSVFISLRASRLRCFLCRGSRWLYTLAAAGGKILLGYLLIASSIMSHGPWISLDVTCNDIKSLTSQIFFLGSHLQAN